VRDSVRNEVRNEESWLVINLGCSDAKQIGLTIPPNMLARAG
jgi:hypothetical protein